MLFNTSGHFSGSAIPGVHFWATIVHHSATRTLVVGIGVGVRIEVEFGVRVELEREFKLQLDSVMELDKVQTCT